MRDFGRTNVSWFANVAARDAFIPSPIAGQLVGVGTDLWKHNGTAWIKVIADIFDPTSVGPDPEPTLIPGMIFEWDAAGGYFKPAMLRGCVRENTGGGTLVNGSKTTISWHNTLWDSGGIAGNVNLFRLNEVGFWAMEMCMGCNITAAVASTSYYSIQVDYPTGTLYRMQKVIPGSTGVQILHVTAIINVTDPGVDASFAAQCAPGGAIYVTSYSPKCSCYYLGPSLEL